MYLDHTETHGNRGQGLRPINSDKNDVETRECSIADVILSVGIRKMSCLRRALATTYAVCVCGGIEKTIAHKLALSGRAEVEEEDGGE